jgi:hypothetical protein
MSHFSNILHGKIPEKYFRIDYNRWFMTSQGKKKWSLAANMDSPKMSHAQPTKIISFVILISGLLEEVLHSFVHAYIHSPLGR